MCLQFDRNADDLPAGDETLCPPDWSLMHLPSLHPILCLAMVQLIPSSPSVYDGFWVAAPSGSNRDIYSS